MIDNASQPPTIFALSSAAGKAGVCVLRVSGAQAWESLAALAAAQKTPEPRKTKLMTLSHPVSRETIDQAMVIGFRAPHSFTGEDVIEYHCHGSNAVLEEMLQALATQPHHRMAQHGEFTRRAFENGKLDLTAAESIADLIDAETKAQKDQALAQMGGALSTLYHGWAADLTKALAYIEAIIDFPDEDVPDSETAKALPAIEKLAQALSSHLDDNRKGEILRSGLQIAVIGAPNAGKSSLVNLLAQRDVAIVSPTAGTTRDIVEVHLNLGGYPVIIADTAGLRPKELTSPNSHDAIESEGIKRALKRAAEADLRILLFDGACPAPDPYTLDLIDENSIIVVNKCDIASDAPARHAGLFHVKQSHAGGALKPLSPYYISTQTQSGLNEFLAGLTAHITAQMSVSRETPTLTRARHRNHLEEALASLHSAMTQTQPELMAQDLRFALTALGRITGRVDVEDLLDVIFKDFCIGK